MPRLWKIILFGLGAVPAMIGGHGDPRCHGGEQGTSARRRPSSGRERPPVPEITRPVMFNTPEADRILSALQVFPPDNPWNEDISKRPVHPNSRNLIASVGTEKGLAYNLDMAFILVPPDQKRVPVRLTEYGGESDPGPYPVPDNAPIEDWPLNGQSLETHQREGKGDRHMLVVDPVNRKLFEFYSARKTGAGWTALQASIFDVKSNTLRPDGWTSSDAAGLPIFPSVIRFDEVQRGMVEHAMRFTIRNSRRAYVYPATHFASSKTNVNLPRMGERFRLRPDFDVSGFSPHTQAVLKGLKKYGMFVADNGGDWRISVAPDSRISGLDELRQVKGKDFEVIQPSGPNPGPPGKRE
ncbi:MAG: hypothetical protein ACHRXM_13510 [Isosphaerales bacterium]